jgi:hypothetical protein
VMYVHLSGCPKAWYLAYKEELRSALSDCKRRKLAWCNPSRADFQIPSCPPQSRESSRAGRDRSPHKNLVGQKLKVQKAEGSRLRAADFALILSHALQISKIRLTVLL